MRETPTQVPGLIPVEHKYVNVYKIPIVIMSDLIRRTALHLTDVLMILLAFTFMLLPMTASYFGDYNGRRAYKAWLWSLSPWRWTKNYWSSVINRATDVE